MLTFLNSPLDIGSLKLTNRLIQGPLAGFSCAPFRQLYYQFTPPAYCVSEMISAHDLLHKHNMDSRYLYRAPEEKILCYQLAGHDANTLAQAATRLASMGADLIDINCGCPKTKIRKKGAGSALLDNPMNLASIVSAVRRAIDIPLTVKIRIHGDDRDLILAKVIQESGADALIVHGRRWMDDYDKPCDFQQIARIKRGVQIPVIANGDITDVHTLTTAMQTSQCDAFMISRAGCGNPWLYQHLLARWDLNTVTDTLRRACFMTHLRGLASLENEHKAILQSKTLVRYYFRHHRTIEQLHAFYALSCLQSIEKELGSVDSP